MSEVKVSAHNGQVCTFDPGPHTYTVDGVELLSATTFIKTFFPPFDTERIAKAYAKKHKRDKDEVIAEWERNRDESAQFGTEIHDFAESQAKGKRYECDYNQTEKHLNYYACVEIALLHIKDKGYTIIEPEIMLWSTALGLAGMADLPLLAPDKKTIVIADWKTSKEIKKENKFSVGYPPLHYYEDCNWVHYRLQFSTYAKMAMLEKFFPDVNNYEGMLIHLTESQPIFMPTEIDFDIIDKMVDQI